jgi:FkbM family methyltransferase
MDFEILFEKNLKPKDEYTLDMLAESACPVIMYGASADVADQIVKKLAGRNLTVDLVVYDDESPLMTDLTHYLCNTGIVNTKEVDSLYEKYNVVLGFVKGYGRIEQLPAKFKNALSINYFSEIFDMEVISRQFVIDNSSFLKSLYDSFADDYSRDSFVAYLMSKVAQDMKYLPPIFDKIQYFTSSVLKLGENESFIDCGAFTGDTIESFLNATNGKYKHIWAAEPDSENYIKLSGYVESKKLKRINLINKGIYSYAGKLPFAGTSDMLSMITEESDNYIDVDTIDNITEGRPVTYIKMDVEGVELQALKGAEHTIRTYKPVLGISIYHKESDLTDIPAYIKSLVPEYKFYFRVHKKLAIDTILYAMI